MSIKPSRLCSLFLFALAGCAVEAGEADSDYDVENVDTVEEAINGGSETPADKALIQADINTLKDIMRYSE